MGWAAAHRVETFIYAHPSGPITLQVSEDNVTFYDMTLSATMTLTEALTEWQTQANAHGTLVNTYSFDLSSSGDVRLASSATAYYKGPNNLWKLLGFASETLGSGTGVFSSTQPLGVLDSDNDGAEGLGYAPLEETGELKPQSFRLGRSLALSFSHAQVVSWTCNLSRNLFNTLHAGPLFRGKVRLWIGTGSSSYSPSDTQGYLDVFPSSPAQFTADGMTDTWGELEALGTLAEGADPAIPSAGSLEELTRGWSYGWGVVYAVKVEGVPYVFVEKDLGASDPANYTTLTGLVVDRSAAIGAVIDRRDGLGAGFDLTLSFMDAGLTSGGTGPTRQTRADASTIRDLFRTPQAVARLTADLAYNGTTATVDGTSAFPAAPDFAYVGRECIRYTGKTATTFTGLTRGAPGGDWRGYDYTVDSAVAAYITDRPQIWRGREVELYAVPVDPFGNVPGSDLLDDAVLIWRGHVVDDPRRRGGLWQMPCRPYDRKLTDPLGAGVSGRAAWALDEDGIVTIDDPDVAFMAMVNVVDGAEFAKEWTYFQPFTAYTAGDTVKSSTWREALRSACETAVATLTWSGTPASGNQGTGSLTNPPTIDAVAWQKTFNNGQLTFRLMLQMTAGAAGQEAGMDIKVSSGGPVPLPFQTLTAAGSAFGYMPSTSQSYSMPSTGIWITAVGTYGLTVIVDDGNTTGIPDSGSIIVEGDDQVSVFEYDKKVVEGNLVYLQLKPGQQPNLAPFAEDLISGKAAEVSVRIGYRDTGPLKDVLRRMLSSSGRGDNGTYDVNELGQGYDLEHVDDDSFDAWLSGVTWNKLTLDVVLDQETSYGSAFGGLLALGNRAVVTRWDGSHRRLTCVSTGLADTGYYVTTITDSELVMASRGAPSVRVLNDAYPRPNAVKVTVEAIPDVEEASVVANDVQAQRAHGVEQWDVRAAGLRLDQASFALQAWSKVLLGLGMVRPQLAEVQVHPGTPAEVGDLVRLELTHPDLWTYSTGLPGYSGAARVLGSRLELTTGIKTLTLMLDGAHKQLALSPSEQITAFDGSYAPPTAPSWVEIRREAYNLFKQWHDRSGDFELAAYIPGSDQDGERWTINGVTDTGAACRLSVSSQTGSFTATTDWFVACPDSNDTTVAQDDHAHCDSEGYWL